MRLHRADDIKIDAKEPDALQKFIRAINSRLQKLNRNADTLEALHETQNKDIKQAGKSRLTTVVNTVGGGSGTTVAQIPEVDTDPLFPANGDVWVRRLENVGQAAGKYMGVGALTYSGIATSQHELSYKTESHGIKRVLLTA